MHSWRVLLLPYLGLQDLYEQYDFHEPWDGPKNRKLAEHSPQAFRCPSDAAPECETSYLAVVGPQTAWPGDQPGTTDASDGSENTILLTEAADAGVVWSEPRDLSLEEALAQPSPESGPAIRSRHSAVVHALFLDGSVRELPTDLPESTFRALLTANGGERVDVKSLPLQRAEERAPRTLDGREGALLVLLASFLLLWFCSTAKRKSQTNEPARDSSSSETPEGP